MQRIDQINPYYRRSKPGFHQSSCLVNLTKWQSLWSCPKSLGWFLLSKVQNLQFCMLPDLYTFGVFWWIWCYICHVLYSSKHDKISFHNEGRQSHWLMHHKLPILELPTSRQFIWRQSMIFLNSNSEALCVYWAGIWILIMKYNTIKCDRHCCQIY